MKSRVLGKTLHYLLLWKNEDAIDWSADTMRRIQAEAILL